MKEAMNHLERFKGVMNFQPVDRLPCVEWAGYWDKSIARWTEEGMDADLANGYCAGTRRHEDVTAYFGLDPWWQHWFRPRGAGFPKLAHGQGPVTTPEDYEKLRPVLFPPHDEALAMLAEWDKFQQRGERVIWITLEGFFWYPRTLFGIERHMYAFYDDPELIHRMNADLTEYHVGLLERLAKVCRPAFMTFAEDMSYNNGPMLSEALFDEFLAPYYRRLVPMLKEMGTRVLVDTDGNVMPLINWLKGVGVEGVLPLERQAGVDANVIRQLHPQWRMIGHYDKMVMPRGEQAMRQEFERLLPAMQKGGFVAGVDHQTPPSVSLEQYRTYVRLLKEYAVRAAR